MVSEEETGAPAARELFARYWRAEEARDVDAIVDCFQPDGEFVDRRGAVRRGPAELTAFYAASVAAFPRVAVRLLRMIGEGPEVAVRYDATLWDRDGDEKRARVVVLATIRDDRFARIETYFDPTSLA